jgi:uncharacterized protein YjbI with pentapeptide repeats
MNDSSRVAQDLETPVNPYSLLEAVNRSSGGAGVAWLIFVALMAYLLIAVAAVSHKELLLDAAVALPILQARVPLTGFFTGAPFLLLLVHMLVIGQFVMLARKALEFSAAVRMLEVSERRTHPLRLELDNLFLVQAIAGPERARVLGALLHSASWGSLVVLPVLLLLYIQAAFLPYHDAAITSLQRGALLCDIALLVLVSVFLWRLETSVLRAFWRTGLNHPIGLMLTAAVLLGAVFVSLALATVPERPGEDEAGGTRAGAGGELARLFPRNLVVTDRDIRGDGDAGGRSINLRGRDLRHARLDRSDLRQADLTGADLDGASLVGADLRGARFACADVERLVLTGNRALGHCASARGADFTRARLSGAAMQGIDLTGALLNDGELEGAELAQAEASGASFTGARLDGADLAMASLIGANLLLASARGADLGGAKLAFADLTGAQMQGVNLTFAGLEGARLRDARLEGATARTARLMGAELAGAKLQGSDFAGAIVWRTLPPAGEDAALGDMAQILLRPPTEEELAALAALPGHTDSAPLKQRLTEGIAALSDAGEGASWASAADAQLWQGLIKASEAAGDGYKGRLTEFLWRLVCRSPRADGALATAVARRALEPGFKGDVTALYDKFKGADCPPAQALGPRLQRELALIGEAAGVR